MRSALIVFFILFLVLGSGGFAAENRKSVNVSVNLVDLIPDFVPQSFKPVVSLIIGLSIFLLPLFFVFYLKDLHIKFFWAGIYLKSLAFIFIWIIIIFVLVSLSLSEAKIFSWPVLSLGLLALHVLFLFFCLMVFCREPVIEPKEIYLREIPFDYSPAIVSLLFNSPKTPKVEHIISEVLDLELKRKVRIEKEKRFLLTEKQLKITILDESTLDLPKSEALILSALAEKAKEKNERNAIPNEQLSVFFSELVPFEQITGVEPAPLLGGNFISKWKKEVEKEAKELELYSDKGWTYFVAGTIIFAFASLFLTLTAFFFLIQSIVLFSVFGSSLSCRTEKGAKHYAEWLKLKRFLGDFSSFNEKSATELPLWEKYLVYAIPLGEADKIIKEARA